MGPQRKPNTRIRTFSFLKLDPLFLTVSIANVDDRITFFFSRIFPLPSVSSRLHTLRQLTRSGAILVL